MTDLFIRSESHEIDTGARKLVPLSFPNEWEHRELTARDYGIDMIMEIFKDGAPCGAYLPLQIKGTSKEIDDTISTISYDVPVNTLKYSELFVSPVLLVLCPINDKQQRSFYIWLQEYIRIVLNYDNPDWRENNDTVRVHIPTSNVISSRIENILWISAHPKRQEQFIKLANLSFTLRDKLGILLLMFEENEDLTDIKKILSQIKDQILIVLDLDAIFGDKKWDSTQIVKNKILIPNLEIIESILNDTEKNIEISLHKLQELRGLSAFIQIHTDTSHARILYESEKLYNF